MEDLRIETYMPGMVSMNCCTVCREKEAAMIDPTDNGACIVNQCRELGMMPMVVLLTHGHSDHIMAVNDSHRLSLPVYAGANEEALPGGMPLNLNTSFGHSFATRADQHAKDGEMFSLLGKTRRVIVTSGHTFDSVYYPIGDENVLFSGGTLFAESLGRTGFPTGSSGQIVASITERPFPLRDDIMVYPGHGEPTTIGHEKQCGLVVACRR